MTWRSFIKKPKVFEYLSVQDFLRDYYEYRKSLNEKFSYDKWSEELNLKGRSLLRLIVTKKRSISDSIIDLFCRQLFESEIEKEYFCHLVLYSQSKSVEEKKTAGRKLTSLLRVHVEKYEISNKKHFLSQTLIPRLYSLLDNEKVEKNPKSLSKLLGVSIEEIVQALSLLQDLKLVQNFEGEYLCNPGAFAVKLDLGDKDLLRFHREALQDSIRAQSLPVDLRRYRSSVALLSQKQWHEILEKFDNVVSQYLELGQLDTSDAQRLFQMNINIHAVSEEVI